MSSTTTTAARSTTSKVGVATLLALALSGGVSSQALASTTDRDNDGMSNTWELTHKLNPGWAGDAKLDTDRDRLSNLREFQLRTLPRDEDTDNDGQDDADEAGSRTNPRDADSDDDRILDGEEDADRDRVANEDEDDATESCAGDDDDLDRDHVHDEDENELRLRVGDSDADDDRINDGAEDRDRDGVQDEDDTATDVCSPDQDGDGEDDEDEGDRYGTITAVDPALGSLTVAAGSGLTYTFRLSADSQVEFEDAPGVDCEAQSDEGALSDLQPGQLIAEVDVEAGAVKEIELLRTTCT